jgi:hypothetical protein
MAGRTLSVGLDGGGEEEIAQAPLNSPRGRTANSQPLLFIVYYKNKALKNL